VLRSARWKVTGPDTEEAQGRARRKGGSKEEVEKVNALETRDVRKEQAEEEQQNKAAEFLERERQEDLV